LVEASHIRGWDIDLNRECKADGKRVTIVSRIGRKWVAMTVCSNDAVNMLQHSDTHLEGRSDRELQANFLKKDIICR